MAIQLQGHPAGISTFWNDGPRGFAARITSDPLNIDNMATTANLLRDHLAIFSSDPPPSPEPTATLAEIRALRAWDEDSSAAYYTFFNPPGPFLDPPYSDFDKNPLSRDQWEEVFKITAAVSTFVTLGILSTIDDPELRARFECRAQDAQGWGLFSKPLWIPVEGPVSNWEYSSVVLRLNAWHSDIDHIDRLMLQYAPRFVMPAVASASFDA